VTALRNIAAIVSKEWRHYFGSPIAWVALFVWTMLFASLSRGWSTAAGE
jgi:ABC-type transport system involved in multi-copper enzyme maturation permease subunit